MLPTVLQSANHCLKRGGPLSGSSTGIRDIFIRANGLRHHLIARGAQGTPIVMMIHGLTGQAHAFDRIADKLGERRHVYCLDVRGRGESEWGEADGYQTDNYVKDAIGVYDGLGLRTISLVGTSMGGMIGMNLAAKHPDRVGRLVLNDIGPEIDPAGMARISGAVGPVPIAFLDMKAVVAHHKEVYGGNMLMGASNDRIAEYARWNVRLSDTSLYVWKMDPAVRKMIAPPPTEDAWDTFRKIKCPVLVLRGAESDVMSVETAKRMTEEIDNCKLVEVANVGHAPMLVEPEAREALETFLPG